MKTPATPGTSCWIGLWLLVLATSSLLADQRETSRLPIRLLGDSPRVLSRVEIDVGWVAEGNPFDPEELAVDAVVTLPSEKTLAVAGFLFQDYDRRLERGREVLTPKGERAWRIRYTPREPGRHAIAVRATRGGDVVARGEMAFEVAPATGRGFVRVEPTSRRYFVFDDGTPLFLNGLCCCWHGRRGTYDYDDWLAAQEKAGINYIRIWMWPIAFGIEWERGDRLKYKLDRAWTVDRLLGEAGRRGIQVMLCFDYHGIFWSKPDFFGGNNYWPQHPYNSADGGPCDKPNDFFTSAAARELYRKRLRYMVARWGCYTNVFAWQFFNEIDNCYRELEHEDVVRWHRDMGRYLRSIDPYDHLITSSLTGSSERKELWQLGEMDFAQFHSYNAKRPAEMVRSVATRFFERYRKPVFVGEYGTDWKGWKPEQDPHFRALHQAVWSGAFTGAAGTSMSWWWESIHREGLYGHWSALAAFLDGTPIGHADLVPCQPDSLGASLQVFGVRTKREALIWCLDPAYDWPAGGRDDEPKAHTGGQIRVDGLTDGDYRVEWWDTLAGRAVKSARTRATDGAIVLDVPGFHVDVAVKVTLEDDR